MPKKQIQKNSRQPSVPRKEQKLTSLWEISRSLYQYRQVGDLIGHIIAKTTGVMNVETMSIALYEEVKNELVFHWSGDLPITAEESELIRIPADKGIIGSIFMSGQAELIPNVAKDPRHYGKIDADTGLRTKSMIAVPLKTKESTIGVMEVINKQKGRFDEQDLDFLLTLSPIIAMALENAMIYASLDTAYRDLQRIDKNKDALIKETKNQVALLRKEVERSYRFDQIIGRSDPMMEVFKLCNRVIDSEITVLIHGETGTGKELIAKTIHFNGPRKEKPFVTQNCGGMPDTLLYSELFGHTKGAFTGAMSDKKGLFELGHNGTVFLDEVADMSPAMQVSLMRVLQEGEFKPLGSEQIKKVDVRLISASNKDLEIEVKAGRFREDLFYRLNVFVIQLPSLRERSEDIPALATHFIKKINAKTKSAVKGLTPQALQRLTGYDFPGNVRELENEIERAMVMTGKNRFIDAGELSTKFTSALNSAQSVIELQGSLKETIEAMEKSIIPQILTKHGGNRTRAAKELGLSRYGLLKKIQRYGL